jgi:hypothetical protein
MITIHSLFHVPVNRRVSIVLLLFASTIALAKNTATRTDAMGAHVNYGHGCQACHIPHSATSRKRNAPTPGSNPTGDMLWGEDVTSTYATSGGHTLPTVSTSTSSLAGVLTCLSCHDGNYGPRAMIRNTIYETLPKEFGDSHTIPTLADKQSFMTGSEIEDHPVGLEAQVRCGDAFGWDCTETNGEISMEGTHSSRFAANYGFFIKPSHSGNTSVVACTTCHNPHLMTITSVTASSASSQFPPGIYSTRYFLRAPYGTQGAMAVGSNQAAQFCRQCHADKSNEMNGSPAGTQP